MTNVFESIPLEICSEITSKLDIHSAFTFLATCKACSLTSGIAHEKARKLIFDVVCLLHEHIEQFAKVLNNEKSMRTFVIKVLRALWIDFSKISQETDAKKRAFLMEKVMCMIENVSSKSGLLPGIVHQVWAGLCLGTDFDIEDELEIGYQAFKNYIIGTDRFFIQTFSTMSEHFSMAMRFNKVGIHMMYLGKQVQWRNLSLPEYKVNEFGYLEFDWTKDSIYKVCDHIQRACGNGIFITDDTTLDITLSNSESYGPDLLSVDAFERVFAKFKANHIQQINLSMLWKC